MSGRHVLVAGATGAIGRVIAQDLAAHGHRVVVHCHRRRDLADGILATLSGTGHTVMPVDLAEATAVEAAVRRLESDGGPIDDVVNAAWPTVPSATVAAATPGDLSAAMAGATAHATLCRATLPSLRRSRGALVFLGGALATRLHAGLGLYGAGKAAATVLTHVLALEEGAAGVRANVISLGRVATEPEADLAETDPVFASLDEIGDLRRVLPLPTPADVAALVRWLLSSESAAVTGQTLTLAGGERV
ncbi:SDR family NAD(P)-dependent oxidoreductase [uncultured Microbacterium sp.]|uniref:Putative enzyme n=1 Tax=uncultured Microbacterium sp. TaxID=191216 RepID=A0A1Y5NZ72_9MICO|nr:SDR family oxidoreductase [uncultured Microbacterium sp.]SBS71742.1 putative enzyme [uncultured Microbacterium sp.]